jgi:hypothetical protein
VRNLTVFANNAESEQTALSLSHHLLLGICGSVAFHASDCRLRAAQPTLSIGSMNDSPAGDESDVRSAAPLGDIAGQVKNAARIRAFGCDRMSFHHLSLSRLHARS